MFSAEGMLPGTPFLGITEDPGHRPNANRIAFWASSREEVERLAEIVRSAGGKISSGPRLCPEYRGAPCGNPLEIMHRTF